MTTLFLEQRMTTQLRITPQQIIANELLQMSVADLEQTVTEETEKNPVLEVIEHERCTKCGGPIHGNRCSCCDGRRASDTTDWQSEGWHYRDYRTRNWDDDEDGDPISRVPGGPSLSQYLMWQLRLALPPKDRKIAQYLVGSLDSHGFLATSAEEAAAYLGVPDSRVEEVILELQKMDPPGIGARNTQEALLIQLRRLREDGAPRPLAETIISHWTLFLKQRHQHLAHTLGVSEEQIRREYIFIDANLNPRPAHAYWTMEEEKPASDTVYVRPDIAIRRCPAPQVGFEAEVLPGHSFTLRIDPEYTRMLDNLQERTDSPGQDAQEQIRDYIARGKLFIRCVNQRWQTLQMIGDCIVDYQRELLQNGERARKPLTRAQLAERIGVHESTVSRAVANKYALLPNGHVVPLAHFFDKSLTVKDVLVHMVKGEQSPLSDRELALRLAREGHKVARRTVAKYRQELGILPARLRST